MDLSSFIVLVTGMLDSSNIHYVVVGGCAKSIYQDNVQTRDLDILIGQTAGNKARFLAFMEKHFNQKLTLAELRKADMIQIKARPFPIDFHFRLDGVSVKTVFKNIETRTTDQSVIPYISAKHLYKNLSKTASKHGIHE